MTVAGLTLTGDRLLGLAALVVLATLALRRGVCWTPVHIALGAFVAVQLLTTALNARAFPPGLRYVTVYVLGFACFAVAATCARNGVLQRWMVGSWLVVAALVAVLGAVAAHLSNFYQRPLEGVWATGIAQFLFQETPHPMLLFAPQIISIEWNLFSSSLLVAFALGLWAWRRESGGQPVLVAAVGAIVFGLVAGVTRAAWAATLAIIALWCAMRRPRGWQVATLGLILATALLVQALALGFSPVGHRIFDHTTVGPRIVISRDTLEMHGRRLIIGSGAGSSTRLAVVMPSGAQIDRPWIANLTLFVLHDSGILGFATFLALVAVVCVRARRALRGSGGEASPLLVPLLIAGSALGFAYQFAHGLWLMYPYVYLGLLTAVTEAPPGEPAPASTSSPSPGTSSSR